MRKMNYLLFAILFGLSNLSAQKFETNLAQQLQIKLESFNVSRGISACVIIPCDNGIWKGVDGISTSSENINSDMLFGMGSCTKNFTATIMLKLAENGLLDIDEPISNYINVSGYTNINGAITIRQLLNHTSGLADYTSNQNIIQYANQYRTYLFTNSDVLSSVGSPQFSPGTSWAYCNTNFYLAGMIIENVTGYDLYTAYNNYIFTPLNLNNIFSGAWETIPSSYNFAHGWYFNQYTWQWSDYSLSSYNSFFSLASSAGYLVTTAEDLAKYAQAIFTGQIISQTSINEMTDFNSNNYGLGCTQAVKAGKTVWGHNGCIQGYASRFLYDPDWGISIAILCNDQNADVETYINELFQVVVNNYQPLAFNIDYSTNVNCYGGNDGAIYTTANGSASPFTYSWTNTSQTTGDISGLSANSYTVTITDMNGCTKIMSETITEPDQLITGISGTNVLISNDGEADLSVAGGTPQYTYYWSNGATTEDIYYLGEGIYYVTVTDANGCTAIDSVYIDNAVKINEHDALSSTLKIYPNPTNGILYVENAENSTICMYDLTGHKIKSLIIDNSIMEINLNDINTGIYILNISNVNYKISQKIHIE
ncbi:MAG: serine hydrolase [Bacteroidota bacterium]